MSDISEMSYTELESIAVTSKIHEQRVDNITHTCLAQVASRFRLPEPVLNAYLLTEGGYPGHIRPNTNGSHDVGPMQINSINWKHYFNKYKISPISIRFDGCINLFVGADIIRSRFDEIGRENIVDLNDYLKVAANYHSKTSSLNATYQVNWARNFHKTLKEHINGI